MRYRRLDSSGDYVIGGGGAFLVDSSEAVAQAVLTRLRLWKGEWFLDVTDGTPWKEEVLGKRSGGRSPDAVIKQRILETPGVDAITAYDSRFDGDSRALSITATIDTQYGTATISEIL